MKLKKGDTVEAVVLAVDPERERISLGVKQLEQDPMGQFMATTPRGSKVTGTVKEVDAKGAVVDLGEGVEGYVQARDISDQRIDDLDMADVTGMADARFALEVAAAGGHHLMLSGPKGAGKTTLAERMPGLLPDLTVEESLELTAISVEMKVAIEQMREQVQNLE